MKAIVIEIQVGGGKSVHSLEEACTEFINMVRATSDTGYRAKLNFTIKLPNEELRSLTVRDEDKETVVYGDFKGLPTFLDYSEEVLGKS